MRKKLTLILVVLLSFSSLFSLDVPELKGRVNDYTGTLSSTEVSNLEAILETVEVSTSSQVALLLISSLEGDSLEDFSMRVVDKWKLGHKDLDNGVLLLVSLGDRKIRIVGQ